MMNGIDISNWQNGIDLAEVPCDFVICKATGGTGYVSPDFKRQIEQALALGKCAGAYHFALDGFANTTPETEAKHFLDTVKPYLGKIALALDWEADAVALGAEWAKRWLEYVYEHTGIRAMIYMSRSVAEAADWAAVAENNALWVAQYANYNIQHGYNADPWGEKTVGKWGTNITIRQYTSSGYLDGWKRRLDLNLAYIDGADWDKLCGKTEEPTEEPEAPAEPTEKTISVTAFARQVIAGGWGNGTERRTRLGNWFADAVQAEVNRILEG